MTNQEFFDTVKNHLLTQGRTSSAESGLCMYHAPDGAKCALGIFIPDALYEKDMEGEPVSYLARQGFIQADQIDLAKALQRVHDHYAVRDWPACLRDVATAFGLVI